MMKAFAPAHDAFPRIETEAAKNSALEEASSVYPAKPGV
jgi:hypothetical protein